MELYTLLVPYSLSESRNIPIQVNEMTVITWYNEYHLHLLTPYEGVQIRYEFDIIESLADGSSYEFNISRDTAKNLMKLYRGKVFGLKDLMISFDEMVAEEWENVERTK